MLPALLDEQRRSLVRYAIAACAASVAILPVMGSPSLSASGAAAAHAVIRVPDEPANLPFPPIPLDRDPFVPDGSEIALASQSLSRNEGATGVVLRAVVTGIEPRALIEAGSTVRVVGVGDKLGNATITEINKTEVVLSNGLELPLIPEHP